MNIFQDVTNILNKEIKNSFIKNVIGVDGSCYETSIDEKLPSTKIGYVKISNLLINMNKFNDIGKSKSRFVDPFEIAKIKNSNNANTFVFPSAYISFNDNDSVIDSFREKLDKQLYNYRTNADDPDSSLRTTLFHLAALRPGKPNSE